MIRSLLVDVGTELTKNVVKAAITTLIRLIAISVSSRTKPSSSAVAGQSARGSEPGVQPLVDAARRAARRDECRFIMVSWFGYLPLSSFSSWARAAAVRGVEKH